MKIKIIILALLASNLCFAQSPVIEISHNYTTQLIFPGEINFCRLAVNEKFFEPQQVANILLLQSIGEFEETNLTVLQNDGLSYSIKLCYEPKPHTLSYIFEQNNAVNNKLDRVLARASDEVGEDSPIMDKILNQPGYITARNAVKSKSFLFSVTGIYIQSEKIYIRLACENLSQIPYKVDLVNFSIGVKKTKDVTSAGVELLTPIQNTRIDQIPSKALAEFVFEFTKFTIGSDNELIIDLIENGGARNVSLTISDELFLTAKPI